MFDTQKRKIKRIGCSYKVNKTILNQDSLNYQENISPLGSLTLQFENTLATQGGSYKDKDVR